MSDPSSWAGQPSCAGLPNAITIPDREYFFRDLQGIQIKYKLFKIIKYQQQLPLDDEDKCIFRWPWESGAKSGTSVPISRTWTSGSTTFRLGKVFLRSYISAEERFGLRAASKVLSKASGRLRLLRSTSISSVCGAQKIEGDHRLEMAKHNTTQRE